MNYNLSAFTVLSAACTSKVIGDLARAKTLFHMAAGAYHREKNPVMKEGCIALAKCCLAVEG